ncbi:MAG: Glutathione transport system permease protein GsiD [Anaerolineae bacterium]|nr:Glutathione transport system permease protein GsiD [Anaerolineae bacterium]
MAQTTDTLTISPSLKAPPKAESLWLDGWRRLTRQPLSLVAGFIVVVLTLTAIFGPMLAPYNPNAINMANRFAAPSLNHLMGTDDFGRDILSRIMVGARVSLQVGLIAVGLAATVGTSLGLLAGYVGRLTDELIMRAMDIIFAFPAILLAIAIMAALGKGITNAMIAIGIVYVPIFARIARSSVLSVREEEFIDAARAIGSSDGRIMLRHIFPNILSPLIVETTLSLSFAILAEAALSFFGLGTQPPDPSWGRMLSEGRAYFQQSAWLAIWPGLAIMLTVLGFNLLGDGLRDALDPRLKNVR